MARISSASSPSSHSVTGPATSALRGTLLSDESESQADEEVRVWDHVQCVGDPSLSCPVASRLNDARLRGRSLKKKLAHRPNHLEVRMRAYSSKFGMHLDFEAEPRKELVQVELPPCRDVLPAVSELRAQLRLMLFRIGLEPAFKLCANDHHIGAGTSVQEGEDVLRLGGAGGVGSLIFVEQPYQVRNLTREMTPVRGFGSWPVSCGSPRSPHDHVCRQRCALLLA